MFRSSRLLFNLLDLHFFNFLLFNVSLSGLTIDHEKQKRWNIKYDKSQNSKPDHGQFR